MRIIDLREPINPAKKFIPIVEDYDYSIYVRYISGRMTKARGHEHDCCGCLCDQKVSFKYANNAVVINVTQSYNY